MLACLEIDIKRVVCDLRFMFLRKWFDLLLLPHPYIRLFAWALVIFKLNYIAYIYIYIYNEINK